jgi:transcription elongation factor Elf1
MLHQMNGAPPGLPCPQCNTLLHATVENLLTDGGINCRSCGLQLALDTQASRVALAQLRQVHDATKQVDDIKNKYR